MNNILGMTTGQIVVQDYRSSSIFDNYKIDYYNMGYEKLSEACQLRKIKSEDVIKELESLKSVSNSNEENYNSWSLDALIDEIELKQRRFIVDRTVEIKNLLHNINRIRGRYDSEITDVLNIINHFSGEMSVHLMKERLLLFPYVKKLAEAKKMRTKTGPLDYSTFDFAVKVMKDEHKNEVNYIKQIAELTNNFIPPDREEGYRILYTLFKSLKKELIQIIHLENNILFPKAIELEKELV